jgi:hypothetical protein
VHTSRERASGGSLNNPRCQAEIAALARAVARGLLSAAERDAILDLVSQSYAGGIAYDPFDVLQHVRPDPRYPQIAALYEGPP